MADNNENQGAANSNAKQRMDALLKDIWIDCPQSRRALNGILTMVDAPQRETAPCILVCGEGGSGKTALKAQLQRRDASLGSPFIFVTATEKMSRQNFLESILEAVGLSPRVGASKNWLSDAILNYMHTVGKKF